MKKITLYIFFIIWAGSVAWGQSEFPRGIDLKGSNLENAGNIESDDETIVRIEGGNVFVNGLKVSIPDRKHYPVFNIPMTAFTEKTIEDNYGVEQTFYVLEFPTEIQIRASTNNFTDIVYGWCSDGTQGTTWAETYSDHDGWLYFSDQTTELGLVKWVETDYLSGQLDAGGTPGMMVIFQPSRVTNDGTTNDWMRASNTNLVWEYTLETASGHITHPDGTKLWQGVVPVEWRDERITIEP